MGFLYNVVARNLSHSGITKLSRNSTDQSALVSFTVNCIYGSIQFMCSRNLSLSDVFCTTNVPSTYLLHILGGCLAVFVVLISKSSMYMLAAVELIGDPKAAPSSCSKNLPWNRNYVFFRQESSKYDVAYWQWCSVLEFPILIQFNINDLDDRIHWHRCKKAQWHHSRWWIPLPEVLFCGPGLQNPWYSWCGRRIYLLVVLIPWPALLPYHMFLYPC